MFLLAILALVMGDPELVEREKLAFIERSIVEILAKGSFPEIFSANNARLAECGCTWGATNILWGTGVGMMCKLEGQFDSRCGQRCSTPKGEDILLLCPEGWTAECENGCVPPPFGSVEERALFLEQNVDQIIQYGYDYILIDPDYIGRCGCDGNSVNAVSYGSRIGFDCEVSGTPAEDCAAWMGCQNGQGNDINMFCPAGHQPSCDGCTKLLFQESTLDERYDWAVNVLTGFIRESQQTLDLTPHSQKVLNCGCSEPLQTVDYGNGIGYYCHIDSPEDVMEDCGQNVVCANGDQELVHFCPDGFVPQCDTGCGYWWKQDL